VLEVVSDRKLGQLLYTYSAVTSGTHIYNAQSNEYIFVGTGGTHNQSGSTTEVNYDSYKPEVITYSDYYPFHMQMPGRFDNTNPYRYGGSNGQEKETEITSSQSHYSAEHWMYDSRIGRRWNIDPVDQISISNYSVFGNNPIIIVDLNGATPKFLYWIVNGFRRFHKDVSYRANIIQRIDRLEDMVDAIDFAISVYGANENLIVKGSAEKMYRDNYNTEIKPKLRNDSYTEPRNLNEHVAMQAAKSGQGEPTSMTPYLNSEGKMVDKYSYKHELSNGTEIEIHYEVEIESKEKANFKFIDQNIRSENDKIKNSYKKKYENKVKKDYEKKVKEQKERIKKHKNQIEKLKKKL
jgi:hypothetical protein